MNHITTSTTLHEPLPVAIMSLRLSHALYRQFSHETVLLEPQLAKRLRTFSTDLERGTVRPGDLYRVIWQLLTHLHEIAERK